MHDRGDLLARIREEIDLPKNVTAVKKGDNNKTVKRVQEHLSLAGFPLVIDGAFGKISELTVKSFQDYHGLTPDGIVGPNTYAKLVEPITNALKRIDGASLTPSELIARYAEQHLASHPREIGGENSGPWVRLYMKGREGRQWAWCAGFVTFIMQQAYEQKSESKPVVDTFSCDRLAESAKKANLFVSSTRVEKGNIPAGSIFLQRREPGDWTHTGIVSQAGETFFDAIEGNTNDQGHREGYEVTKRRRSYEKRDFIVFKAPEIDSEILLAQTEQAGIHKISDSLSVRRHFFDEERFETYGSFFNLWGGWATAAHVTEAASQIIPGFASGPLIERPGSLKLDAAFMGCTFPTTAPPQLTAHQRVEVLGFPAGSAAVARRLGQVHARRPEGVSWIVRIESPNEPVTSGMSGGVVVDLKTKEPVGIIIERNSKADLDLDPEQDHSLNIVSLHDAWMSMNDNGLIV